MKKLHVVQTCRAEICEQWGFIWHPPSPGPFYIRCDVNGKINWTRSSVYRAVELLVLLILFVTATFIVSRVVLVYNDVLNNFTRPYTRFLLGMLVVVDVVLTFKLLEL